MKLAAICVILVVGLMFQVSHKIEDRKSFDKKNFVIFQFQSNEVDAFFWQFLKPFLPGSTVVMVTGNTNTPSSSSSTGSSGNSTNTSDTTIMSTGNLNQSNALLVSGGSSVMANIDQNFGNSSQG